jgi:hypothetical protein
MCADMLSTVVVGSQFVPGNAVQSAFATQPGKQVLLFPALRMQKPFCPNRFTPPELPPAQSAEVVHVFVHHPAHWAGSHAQFLDKQMASDEHGSPRPAVHAVQLFSAHERRARYRGTPLGKRCAQSQVEVAQDDSQVARLAQLVWAAQLVASAQQVLLMHASHVVSVGRAAHVMGAASFPATSGVAPASSPPPPPSPDATL